MKKQNKSDKIHDIGKNYFEIIRRKTSWEEYIFDAKEKASKEGIISKMKALNSSIRIQIPSKDNIRYTHIKNFEEHNLSNNLALDMIIRNSDFQNMMYKVSVMEYEFENKPIEEKEKYYKKLQLEMIKKFGFDIKEELNLLAHHPYINEQITDFVDNVANESIILNPPYISDLENGLRRVIDFYIKKKKLYLLIPPNYEIVDKEKQQNINHKRLFVKIISPTTNEDDFILSSVYEEYKEYFQRVDKLLYYLPKIKLELVDNIDDNFIKRNLNYLGIPVVTFGTEKIVSLAEESFPIEFLDKEFISSLSADEVLDAHFKDSKDKSILSKLKLINSKRINSNINVKISADKTKDDISNLYLNSKNIKSFAEIFNMEVEEILKVKNFKYISKTKEKRNRDYANAFFIYDLYKIIGNDFDIKISELEQEAEDCKNKIEDNEHYGKEAKEHEYNKIEEKLRINKSLFSKTSLDKEIQKITGLEISKIRGLHSCMEEYIEHCKFKNVILDK